MKKVRQFITATLLLAGIFAISIPLAAAAHKKLAKEMHVSPMEVTQMMIDAKNLPTVLVAEPY